MTEKRTDSGEAQGAERVDTRRRRLGQAIAAGVPVLAALQHRPVRAAWVCHSPSGFTSMTVAASYRPREPMFCSGRSPGFWRNRTHAWSRTPYEPGKVVVKTDKSTGEKELKFIGGTRFFDVFLSGTTHFRVAAPKELSLLEVLYLGGAEDPAEMGAHFVAALLNAASGRTDPLPATGVVQMWQDFIATGGAAGGYYEPPPGFDRWYAEDIKEYFYSTWA